MKIRTIRSRRSLAPLKDSHVTEPNSSSYIRRLLPQTGRSGTEPSEDISLHLNNSFKRKCPASQTMEGYGVSDEELFASSLHNFTWENSFEQMMPVSKSSSRP